MWARRAPDESGVSTMVDEGAEQTLEAAEQAVESDSDRIIPRRS
jgi:hypothetical protein